MALIFLKILIIVYLTISVFFDFSALAVCTDTTNCSSENNQFPNITLFQNLGIDIKNEKEVVKNYIKVQETFSFPTK